MARATLDIDLVADLSEKDIGALVRDLGDDYYSEEDAMREAVRRRATFNLIHLATMVKVDVFALKTRPYDIEAFARARPDLLGEGEGAREFYLASAEDVVLNKLEWYEMGGRVADRQWRDVIGVLKVQAERLDRAYMERWAADIGVAELLARALEEAGCHEKGSDPSY
jgi:hypothetical protein